MTLLVVVGALGGAAALLWLAAAVESRMEPRQAADPMAALTVVVDGEPAVEVVSAA